MGHWLTKAEVEYPRRLSILGIWLVRARRRSRCRLTLCWLAILSIWGVVNFDTWYINFVDGTPSISECPSMSALSILISIDGPIPEHMLAIAMTEACACVEYILCYASWKEHKIRCRKDIMNLRITIWYLSYYIASENEVMIPIHHSSLVKLRNHIFCVLTTMRGQSPDQVRNKHRRFIDGSTRERANILWKEYIIEHFWLKFV